MFNTNPEIGFWGGMALLVSSITGPALTTVPLIFQQSGWLLPVIAIIVVGILSASASLLLVEAMNHVRGNERFQAQVEFTTIAQLYLGRKLHYILQVILYLALQSVNISSIIISCQSMDTILIQLFHKTCAITFTQGWVCETSVTSSSGSPFDLYILISFGYLIAVVLVLPLSLLRLGQNIFVQLASATALICVFIMLIFAFCRHGLKNTVPVVGDNGSQLVGFVISNFAFVTTVPSFVNELSRKVGIHRTICFPVIFCIILYIILGILGATSFHIEPSSNILATISSTDQGTVLNVLSVIINVVFPVSVLVTSIPVFSIVIRYNLIRSNVCSKRWALFWAAFFPWILVIPFQTMGWLNIIMNWTSLLFASTANFVIPFLLYFASKRYHATAFPSEDISSMPLHTLASPFNGSDSTATEVCLVSDSVLPRRPVLPRLQTLSGSPQESHARVKDDDEKNEFARDELGKQDDDWPNITVVQHRQSGSIDQTCGPLTCKGIEACNDTQSESPALTPIDGEMWNLGPRVPSGNLLRHRSGRSKSRNSIDLEHGSVIRYYGNSADLFDNTRKYLDDSGQNSLDAKVLTSIVETVNQMDQSNSTQSRQLSFRLSIPASNVSTTEPEPQVPELFHAFPETRWFGSVAFAAVGFCVMTLMVFGNLIYTYSVPFARN